MFRNIIITLLLFCTVIAAYGQNKSAYHINTKNGLPTNFTYQVIKDRFGYLWFATENGVFKYNGYELKTFDLSNGLSNNDVWRLSEDNKGRIWLHTISDELGYIYNDHYHKLFFKDKDSTSNFIQARGIANTKTGISFFPGRNVTSNIQANYCIEKNDTVKSYKIFKESVNDDTSYLFEGVHEDGYGIFIQGHAIKKLYVQNDSLRVVVLHKHKKPEEIVKGLAQYRLFGNNIFIFQPLSAKLFCVNLHTGQTRRLNIFQDTNQFIFTITFQDDKMHIITNKCIYVYDKKISLIKLVDINKILPDFIPGNNNITSLLDDDFWGTTLSTTENGVYINCNNKNYVTLNHLPPPGYSYIGHSSDSSFFWWNGDKLTLHTINKKDGNRYLYVPHLRSIKQAIPYNNEKTLLIASDSLYWFNSRTNTVSNFLDNISKYKIDGKIWPTYSDHEYATVTSFGVSSVVFTSANTMSVNSQKSIWCYYYFNNDSLYSNTFLRKRLHTVVYDHKRKMLYSFDEKNIYIKPLPNGKLLHINKASLNTIGVKKLEKILVDTSGNIFIKDYDRLIFFNPEKRTYKYILQDYMLHNTTLFFFKNKLIVSGDFGAAFITINKTGTISSPYIELNNKKTQYDKLFSSYVRNNDLFLFTNKGLYSLQIPNDNAINTSSGVPKYRMLISNNKNTKIFSLNDSVHINPKDYTLLLDVIKPSGVGKLSYRYRISGIDKEWKRLPGNEIYTAGLSPGKYYDLSIIANDEIWISNTIKLKIFVIPYWWQTNLAKNLFLLFALIFTLGVVAFTVVITRRILSRKHKQQKMQLELKNLNLALELKSIYAQINPHFIFNTLSTTLYFIKKKKVDEAYNHVTSFSDLLRAYIKSSRSKYISIKEEIENLTNYISLQQARFENKFKYQIITDDRIDATKTFIPALLLQPLVENAINHGLLPSDNEIGQLIIRFAPGENEGDMFCTIQDNGIGRERSKQLKKENHINTESYGTDLIHELIELFNKNENMYITLDYTDMQPPQHGTTVVISIKQKL